MELSVAGRSRAPAAPVDVWLDVDPAAGLPERDVDDALAIIQACHSPELVVRGVSVVYGNCPLVDGVPIAREVVGRFGPPGLAVHPGAASAAELGRETDAVRAMASALGAGPLTILALGPATNVGTLVRCHPELHRAIASIVVVAGRRLGQRFLSGPRQREPFPDFNFENDPAAMTAILGTSIPLVLAPWEVSSHLWLTPHDLAVLAGRSSSGAWIAERSQSWLALWQREFGADGFNPFDTLAVAWVTHPELIESMEVGVWIEEAHAADHAESRGADALVGDAVREYSTEPAPLLLVDPACSERRRATYCHRPRAALKAMLLERLAARPPM